MYSIIMLMFVCGSAFFFLSPHLTPFLLCCTPVSVHDIIGQGGGGTNEMVVLHMNST